MNFWKFNFKKEAGVLIIKKKKSKPLKKSTKPTNQLKKKNPLPNEQEQP